MYTFFSVLSRFYNYVNIIVVVVRIDQSQSNVRRMIDCDWSITYNYVYVKVESA